MDIYSRYVVGWCVTLGESAATAADLMLDACLKNNIAREQLTIHADRGSAMSSKTVGQLLIDLDVQIGHYPPNAIQTGTAAALAQFDVEGEHRYWLHVAIDRYTGQVIDEQLEVVISN